MRKYLLLIFLSIIFFSHYTCINAQKRININSPDSKNLIKSTKKPSYITEDKIVRNFKLNPQIKQLSQNNIGDTLLLDLFTDKKFKAVIERIHTDVNNIQSITAKILNYQFASCFIINSSKRSYISIKIPETLEEFEASDFNDNIKSYLTKYKIKTEQNFSCGTDKIIRPELNSKFSTLNNTNPSQAQNTKNPDDPAIIDVLFVYPTATAKFAESKGFQVEEMIAKGIEYSNLVMKNSLTGVTFNLAHSMQINVSDEWIDLDNEKFLRWLNPKSLDSNFEYKDEHKKIHDARDDYSADLVVFLLPENFNTGVANGLFNEQGNSEQPFAVIGLDGLGTFVITHELSHNFGCGHHKDQSTQPGPLLYPFSSAWRWPNKNKPNNMYCTIMSYGGNDFEDKKMTSHIPYLSNPEVFVEGSSTGDTQYANNTLTIKKTKHVVAGYRDKGFYNIILDHRGAPLDDIKLIGNGKYKKGDSCTIDFSYDNKKYKFLGWINKLGGTISIEKNYKFVINSYQYLTAQFKNIAAPNDILNVVQNNEKKIQKGDTLLFIATYSGITKDITFEWTLPEGISIVSNMLNNQFVYLYFSEKAKSGYLTVKAKNTYGESPDFEHFIEISPYVDITLISNPENAGTLSGEGRYEDNELVNIKTQVNNPIYKFINWTDEKNNIVSESPDFILKATINKTITANYETLNKPTQPKIIDGEKSPLYNKIYTYKVLTENNNAPEDTTSYLWKFPFYFFVEDDFSPSYEYETKEPYISISFAPNSELPGEYLTVIPKNNLGEGDSLSIYITFPPVKYNSVELYSIPKNAGILIGSNMYPEYDNYSKKIKAEPFPMYKFNYWSQDDHIISTDPEFEFDIFSDLDFTANFELISIPANLDTISGQKKVIPFKKYSYTTNTSPGAAYYKWSLPDGAEAETTTTEPFIEIYYNENAKAGTLSVKAGNEFGETPACSANIIVESPLVFPATNKKLKITPNPVSSILNILLLDSSNKEESLKIYNLSGALLLDKKVSNGQKNISIDIKEFKPGVYLLNFQNKSYKFIKI